ncbi:hypothetical protein GCM10018793_18140 [Streptomyces sulfonofaciens]|uniref:FMN-binding domain-containing protein n=1 Tax=Streptomyces sulfonofaciens TaxID=68272 RepID=A0A919G0A5_9ACTN|nr:hypothetical protein GCM10018793_18140 [Streptomyces sulfonofaciens]
MRRAVLATVTTLAGVVVLLSLKPHQSTPAVGAPAPSSPRDAGPSSGSSRASHHAVAGTSTGTVSSTPYGPVQVAVTMAKGRITGIKVLQSPTGAARSRQIAAMAVPRLTREALAAQDAGIDAVSGASYTSQGYIQSLQSALDRAGDRSH